MWRPRGALGALLVGPGGVSFFSALPGGVPRGSYVVTSFGPTPLRPGLVTPLRWVPVGTQVSGLHFVARAPGTALKVLRHRGGFTECRLPSRGVRWFNSSHPVQVGPQGNPEVRHLRLTSAGDAWRAGRLPRTRGVAMNPVDHPHGGGQGKTAGGGPGMTPWGRLTKGYRTVR